jgi:type I restriction enzyme, S subunit
MNWQRVPIRVVAPSAPSDLELKYSELVWHLTLDQIESNTGFIINKRVAPMSESGNSTFAFDKTHVLYSKLRPYLNKVICPDEAGIATTELIPLQPDKRLLERRFLMYYLRSKEFLNFATVVVAGIKMPRMIMSKFWEYRIPLPTLSEQRRIVELIDQTDALRKKRAEADKKAGKILPALFNKMFGNPITELSGAKWPLKPVDSIAEVSYGLPDRLDSSLTATEGTRIITISNITLNGYIDSSVERYTLANVKRRSKASVQINDLLFNWRNGSKEHVGKTAIWEDNWPGEVLHVSFLLRIRPDTARIEPYYMWSLLNLLRSSGYFVMRSRMQINSKFNASELCALKIPLPPRELQASFARQVSSLREIATELQASRIKTELAFESLLYQAFTGDLTAKWREAHMKELLAEMKEQAKILGQKTQPKA